MVYTTISVKPVIGRIIRTSRLNDMTYADNIIDWIGEAYDRLMIRWRLDKKSMRLDIKDHKHKLPCDLVSLDAVIYKGSRLRKGTASIDARILKKNISTSELDSYFVSDTTIQPADINSQNISLLRGLDIQKVDPTILAGTDFYDLQYDYIKTSFCEGCITICYRDRDVDKEGYPLLPDLEEAKEGVFWYVLSRLCIGGYKLPDPKMDFDYCDAKATKFFRKAKNIIKTPSEDEKEAGVQLLNNLIPPPNYYQTFFAGAEQRKYVNI